MEDDISKLNTKELKEKISELGYTYAEFFFPNAEGQQLLQIKARIQEKKGIDKRSDEA